MFNKMTLSHIVCAVALFVSANVFSEADITKPPVIPEPLQSGESIEADINIIQKNDRTIEEYRANGRLYMVKVTPAVGPVYYYVDTDGDGSLETKRHDLAGDMVPNWVVLEW